MDLSLCWGSSFVLPAQQNKMPSTSWQLELLLKCAVTAERPGLACHGRGLWHCVWDDVGTAQGFLASSASESTQQLFSKEAWVAASKFWVQTSVSVSCCAGDWCKPFDVIFRRTSMDLRAITNSATCFFSQVSLLFATSYLLSHPALLLCGSLENCLYTETGFSQWSTTQMLEHSLINRKKFGSWVELVVLTQIFMLGLCCCHYPWKCSRSLSVDVALGHMVNGECSSAGLIVGLRLQVHLHIPARDLLDSVWF